MATLRRWCAIAWWLAFLWPAPARAQLVDFTSVPRPPGPASLQGMFDAGTVQPFLGAYQFSLPIEVPDHAGLAPDLTLSYSSGTGSGLLGGSWTITVPLIRRSLRSGVPSYTNLDQFELVGLGGGRLVPDPQIANQYWVEGRGKNLRVRFIDWYFELTDDDGTVYTFGVNTGGQMSSPDGTKIAEWRLQTIRALGGTQITFSYTRNQLQLYPSTVLWGPLQGGAPVYRVEFGYETRPDQVISYRPGFRVITQLRLKTLALFSFGQTARSYTFNYHASTPTRLASIQPYGRQGATGLNPIQVSYDDSGPNPTGPRGDFAGWMPGASLNVIWLDLDRDGFNDLIKFDGSGTCPYRRNHGGASFSAPATISCPALTLDQIDIVDLDGDGFLDLAQKPMSGPWSYHRIEYLGFQDAGTWPGTDTIPHRATFTDVNGDGRADAIAYSGSSGFFDFYIATPTGFGPRNFRGLESFDPRRLLDFNHDGLIDYYVPTLSGLKLYFGRGDTTFEFYAEVPFSAVQGNIFVYNRPDEFRITDFDKDGFSDAVEVTPTHFYFHRGRGDLGGFEPPVAFANPSGSVFCATTNAQGTTASCRQSVLDLNGNGSLDAYAFTSDARLWYVDLAGENGTGRGTFLHTLDQGLGAQVIVDYASTGGLGMADELDGEPWWSQPPLAFPVVTSVYTYLGPEQPSRSTSYRPSLPYWDPEERVLAGFLRNTVTESGSTAADSLKTVSYFLAGTGAYRTTRGIKYYEEKWDFLGQYLGYSYDYWSVQAVSSLPEDPLLYVPVLIDHYAQTGGSIPETTETYFEYDADGRIMRMTDYGALSLSGDEAIAEWDYVTPDDQTWVRDKVCAARLKRGDWVSVADSRFYYGDSSGIAPLCTAGKGWIRQIDRYFDREDRYVRTFARTYDALGNPTSNYDGRVTLGIGYDSLGLQATSRSIQVSPDSTLSWNVQWDSVIDRVLQVTAPDGTVDVLTYDPFGRLTSEAKQGLPAHVHYDYAWTGNFTGVRPKTTTWVFDGDTSELSGGGQPWPTGSKWRPITRVMNGLMEPQFESVPSAPGQYLVSSYVERDPRGKVATDYEPFYASAPEPTSVPAGTRYATTAFDALGRPTVRTVTNGAQTAFYYDGLTTTTYRPDIAPVSTRYDGLGRVIRAERSVGGVLEFGDYLYDAMNNLTQVTLQGGAVVSTFVYDSLGRVTDAIDPDSGHQGWTYDDRSFVSTHVNGAGDLTRYSYDAAGRLTRKGEGPVIDDALDYIYYYDTPLNTGDARTRGRLAWVHEPDGQMELSYGAFGKPISVRRVVSGAVSQRMPVYSPSGLKLRETFDDGFSVVNGFDRAGRPISAGDYWVADELDAASRSVSEHFGNGVTAVHGFDQLGLIDRVTVMQSTGTPILDLDVDRYSSGRPASVVDYDGTGVNRAASFLYDDAGRLFFSYFTGGDPYSSRWFQTWYDTLQNPLYRASGNAFGSLVNGWFNYGENGHGPRQVTSVSPWSSQPMPTVFDYDGAGRQTQEFDAALAYDGFDRLTSITTPPGLLGPGARDVNVQYTYGADNLRTSMVDSQGSTRERWFDSDIREVDGQRQYIVSVGDRIVAQVTRSGGVNTANYYHQGLTAGPELITGVYGEVVEDRLFESFGYPIDVSSGNGTFDFQNRPINSLNKPTDSESGFGFHGARWYIPEIGRWATPDPEIAVPSRREILTPWGLNPYQYGGANPLLYWDADGEAPGRFNPYPSKGAAQQGATTDAFIATKNNGYEHGTLVYRSDEAGGYFYTPPDFGTKEHPEGDPHAVDIRLPPANTLPDDAVLVEVIHTHNEYDVASHKDEVGGDKLHKRGVADVFVDPEGNVREIGTNKILGTVDQKTLDKLKQFEQDQQRQRDKKEAESIADEFEEGDHIRALLTDWYKLSQDPTGYAKATGSEWMTHPWKHVL